MPSSWSCGGCRARVTEAPFCTINDDPICDACGSDTAICSVCESYFWREDSYTVDEESVCPDCFSEEYTTCYMCSCTIRQDEEENLNGLQSSVCRVCYDEAVECNICSEKAFTSHTYNRLRYCSECLKAKLKREFENIASDLCDCDACTSGDQNLVRAAWSCDYSGFRTLFNSWNCGLCGNTRYSEMPIPSSWRAGVLWFLNMESEVDWVCAQCSDQPTDVYIVNSYSYKPIPKFKKSSRDLENRALHFGTEVEVEMIKGGHTSVALGMLAVSDGESLFYCKSDSCISNGFEVVSHPFTYDWMRENNTAFDSMFGLSKVMRGFISMNCGMHIHMSLDAFTNLQLMKFMRFFYKNKEFITAIARRPPGKLDAWAHMTTPKKGMIQGYARKKSGTIGTGRSALNVEGSKTIECRIFRSTLSPTAYFGNIEFLQSLFDYTKTCGLHQLQYDRFIGYVHDRGSAYNNFVTLLKTVRPMSEEV